MAKRPKFSMRPEFAEEGLLSNADVEIVEAVACTYEAGEAPESMFQGGREPEDPCGKITFSYLEGDDKPIVQFFSAGKAARLVPSEDGEKPADSGPFLIPAEDSKAKGLSASCNLNLFLKSLIKPAAGKLKFNSEVIDEKGLTALVGTKLHVLRVPAPEIGGIAREEGQRERTILTCHEILELPTGKKGAGGIKKKKPAAAEEQGEEEDDATTEAQQIVVAALAKAGEAGIKKDNLVKKCFLAASKAKHKKDVMALLQDDDFTTDSEAPWNYDEDSETLTAIGEE